MVPSGGRRVRHRRIGGGGCEVVERMWFCLDWTEKCAVWFVWRCLLFWVVCNVIACGGRFGFTIVIACEKVSVVSGRLYVAWISPRRDVTVRFARLEVLVMLVCHGARYGVMMSEERWVQCWSRQIMHVTCG
jgi:hypothetical protein